jgi:uroporphyrinogen-III synthase
MNILITRPLIDAEDIMSKLFSLGHKIIHLPTLKILPKKTDPIDENEYDAFVFTSSNAIRNLNVINQNKTKLCFCVGSITEKLARQKGYNNTISAGGTVNALKNLIISSNQINKKSKIAYFCGDYIFYDLETELKREGISLNKIINYTSEKITDLNEENKKIISNHPPDIIFVYSTRSAQSFITIVKNYSLHPLMTESKVMCISNKVLNEFKKAGWKKLEIFEPGSELLKIF